LTGIQIYAELSRIPILDKLVHREVKGLILQIGWSQIGGFNLKVLPRTPIVLELAPKLHTKEIGISIRTSPPQLAITSELEVPVARSNHPLVFSFNLVADEDWVKIRGERDDWWHNPLGISKHVKIGPILQLSLDLELKKWSGTVIPQ
jgi:hypothetical protein